MELALTDSTLTTTALDAIDSDFMIEELEDRAQPMPPIACGCSTTCDCTSCCCGPTW